MSTATVAKRFYTVAQAAKYLSLSVGAVYDLVESRRIPFYRLGRDQGAIRFEQTDLDDYIADSRIMPPPPEQPRRSRGPVLRSGLKHLKRQRRA